MIKIKSGQDWSFDNIDDIYEQINEVATTVFKLNPYQVQLEIISSEQMLDAYVSSGLPIYYPHWSFGEQLVKESDAYNRGRMGLAYEIVINSNPCIAYLMEENTMLMQTLVIAHAAFGHNHFFKNNYMFKQWTDADGIVDYLSFAKNYILQCEEKYGDAVVEEVIDAAHALQLYSIDKYKRPAPLSAALEKTKQTDRDKYNQQQLNLIWNTIPSPPSDTTQTTVDDDKFPQSPQENILYFVEKNAPKLEEWKREIIRIIRRISQYFYPQRQTHLMNEGCATYFHYKIIHELYNRGIIDEGAMFEFYETHTAVTNQSEVFLDNGEENPHYSGFNVYALGFAMFNDIERIANNPTEEDREWFINQPWVGSSNWLETIHWAINNFKDESFIMQFLSPALMREFKMFVIHDDENDPMLEVSAIQNKQGYQEIRNKLAKQYNIGYSIPDIQVVDVDRWGDRSLTLRHYQIQNRPIHNDTAVETMRHLQYLWGYDIKMESISDDGNKTNVIHIGDHESVVDVFNDDD